MSSFVEKLRVPVRLSQPNQDPRDGWFLLFPHVEDGDRPESLVELLDSRRSVIPFLAADDGSVVLLTRLNIDWVAVGAEVGPPLLYPPHREPTHQQRAELRFLDERRIEVTLQWRAETEHNARLSDFLNSGVEFVMARAGFGTLIVNKQRIRETRIAAAAAQAKVA
jgi:hypothetical protein